MKFFGIVLLALSVTLVACSPAPESETSYESAVPSGDGIEAEVKSTEGVTEESVVSSWKEATLTDITTGDSFTVQDFAGKPVLVEMFAVWCPNCLRQQNHMKELHEQVGDAIEFVAIGADPNENAEKILEHVATHKFTSRYVVNPPEVTQALVAEFGPSIVSPPGTPVVLVCPSGTASLLPSGSKSAKALLDHIDTRCA